MTFWNPIALLANVKLLDAIEAEYAAFVSTKDSRVQNIVKKHPYFALFLEKFFDEFNQKRCTTVLLLNGAAPSAFGSVDAMASIRDMLSASVIPRARARRIQRGFNLGICYSSAFDFYPWMISKDYTNITSYTPELQAFHVVDNFKGHIYPGIPSYLLSARAIDKPLFGALLSRWKRAYNNGTPHWEDIKLMRSLNMAYHACQSPGGSETSIFDYGRTVALWVSALEILIHPGSSGNANRDRVRKLLKEDMWIDPNCKALACDICGFLYDSRNDFLHGNPIEQDSAKQCETLNLVRSSALLYRMALTAFLGLKLENLEDAEKNIEEFGTEELKLMAKEAAETANFHAYQKIYEAAIHACHTSISDARELK